MAKILEMPKLSPTMEEGQIGAWHKKEGDAVAVDDLLAEVETDKATMEFRSFDKGTLLKILAPSGAVVRLGQPVAILGQPGEDVSALTAGLSTYVAGATTPHAAVTMPQAVSHVTAPGAPAVLSLSPGGPPPVVPSLVPGVSAAAAALVIPAGDIGGRVKASPHVRKLAREQGLDLARLSGSGPNGRIVARDLSGAPSLAPTSASASAPTTRAGEPELRPLSMMRKAIARRLTESKQTVPHFYLGIDVDADALAALRERINDDLLSSGAEGAPKVSLNDLIVKACALALVRVPECNAQFSPEAIVVHHRVDVSVAVSVPDGLVTPVVRDADKKSVLAIAAEVRDLAARARAKKLRPEEMQNGTFSVSNLGMYGIDEFAAVINPPEGAILAVGQVRREPVVRGDDVVPGRRMALTLSCDHRVVDGAVGATFLKALRNLLEHPSQILLY